MLPVGKKSYRGSASLMSLGSGSAQLGAAASGGKQQRKATLTSLASSVPTVQTAHDLDLLYRTLFRAEMRTEAVVAIQAAWRGHALRTFILPFEAVALRLQAGLRARLEARRRRQNRAATRIQAVARGRRGRRIAAEVRRAFRRLWHRASIDRRLGPAASDSPRVGSSSWVRRFCRSSAAVGARDHARRLRVRLCLAGRAAGRIAHRPQRSRRLHCCVQSTR